MGKRILVRRWHFQIPLRRMRLLYEFLREETRCSRFIKQCKRFINVISRPTKQQEYCRAPSIFPTGMHRVIAVSPSPVKLLGKQSNKHLHWTLVALKKVWKCQFKPRFSVFITRFMQVTSWFVFVSSFSFCFRLCILKMASDCNKT